MAHATMVWSITTSTTRKNNPGNAMGRITNETMPMPYRRLKWLAKRGRYIRWITSGIVEQLDDDNGVWLINPVTGRRHKLSQRDKRGKLRPGHYCEVMNEDALVPVGKLYDAIQSGRNKLILPSEIF